MKVTTSCSGRFHIYDQARQLHRHGVLHRFINDYPRWFARRWGIPGDRVTPLVLNGVLGRASRYTSRVLSPAGQSRVAKAIHDLFSRRVADHLPLDSDVYIGLSSFCLEALRKAADHRMLAVVDHGSLHLRTEYRLLAEESERLGLPAQDPSIAAWAIEKEDEEFAQADCVMVLSSVARRSLIENGVPQEKIFVNPCGVDLSLYRKAAKQDGVFRIVQCGGINTRKGVHYLLKAFSELDLKNAELWFIGGGRENAELAPLIRRHAAANIRFLGAVPQERLPALYSQCSISVLASVSDGFGLVVPQAMACGLPVIVTENVGASDIVSDGVDGFVIPVRDVDALKDRIARLYGDSNLRRSMSEAAIAKATGRLGWDHYGDRLVARLGRLNELRHQPPADGMPEGRRFGTS